jgi:cyclopropane fatty-acyl-phospholipid synthase-like methyltransferase
LAIFYVYKKDLNKKNYSIFIAPKPNTMNPNKALWEKGDFTQIANTMRESGEALVAKLGITKGLDVLDLGCGDGTTAIPEARLGADVLGVDIAQNLVKQGTSVQKQRASLTVLSRKGMLQTCTN